MYLTENDTRGHTYLVSAIVHQETLFCYHSVPTYCKDRWVYILICKISLNFGTEWYNKIQPTPTFLGTSYLELELGATLDLTAVHRVLWPPRTSSVSAHIYTTVYSVRVYCCCRWPTYRKPIQNLQRRHLLEHEDTKDLAESTRPSVYPKSSPDLPYAIPRAQKGYYRGCSTSIPSDYSYIIWGPRARVQRVKW